MLNMNLVALLSASHWFYFLSLILRQIAWHLVFILLLLAAAICLSKLMELRFLFFTVLRYFLLLSWQLRYSPIWVIWTLSQKLNLLTFPFHLAFAFVAVLFVLWVFLHFFSDLNHLPLLSHSLPPLNHNRNTHHHSNHYWAAFNLLHDNSLWYPIYFCLNSHFPLFTCTLPQLLTSVQTL